jgi:transcriptional regulator with XRE-family HTH domain
VSRRGRPLETQPGRRAGLLLLRWAVSQPPGAVVRLADELGVSSRTIMRWIASSDPAQEPSVTQAVRIEELTGVPIEAWVETV